MKALKLKKLALVFTLVLSTLFVGSTGFAQSYQQPQQPNYGHTTGGWDVQRLGAQVQGLYRNLQQMWQYGSQLQQRLRMLHQQMQYAHPQQRQAIYMQMQRIQRELQMLQMHYRQAYSRLQNLYGMLQQLAQAEPSEQVQAALGILRPFTKGHPQARTAVDAVSSLVQLLQQGGVI